MKVYDKARETPQNGSFADPDTMEVNLSEQKEDLSVYQQNISECMANIWNVNLSKLRKYS